MSDKSSKDRIETSLDRAEDAARRAIAVLDKIEKPHRRPSKLRSRRVTMHETVEED